MAIFKKKYETIECSNEHIFSLDYDGVIRQWKCVVLEDEVVTYEGDVECKHLKITNKERAPHVLQIDVHTTIYGEQIPFQLENGIPFIKLQGEWVSSDNFQEARLQAQVRMYRRGGYQQLVFGLVMALGLGIYSLIKGGLGDLWMFMIFAVFFCVSGMNQLVRVRNELNAIREAEQEDAEEAQAMREYLEESNRK